MGTFRSPLAGENGAGVVIVHLESLQHGLAIHICQGPQVFGALPAACAFLGCMQNIFVLSVCEGCAIGVCIGARINHLRRVMMHFCQKKYGIRDHEQIRTILCFPPDFLEKLLDKQFPGDHFDQGGHNQGGALLVH